MINLIGAMPGRSAILGTEGAHLHDYAKAPRPGRKLGHVTLVERTAAVRDRRARRLLRELAAAIRIP
jgi:5-(carboxyamino)imidazole ribonucleotide synthase